jgi:hypothetical protein
MIDSLSQKVELLKQKMKVQKLSQLTITPLNGGQQAKHVQGNNTSNGANKAKVPRNGVNGGRAP